MQKPITMAQKAVETSLQLAPNATRNTYQLRAETGYKSISTHIFRLKKAGAIIRTEYGLATSGNIKHKGVASYTLVKAPQ